MPTVVVDIATTKEAKLIYIYYTAYLIINKHPHQKYL